MPRRKLGLVSDMVPGLLRGLRDVLFSKEAAETMGEVVGTFYTKLVNSGIPKDVAVDVARGYMFDLRKLLESKGSNGRRVHIAMEHSEKDGDD